MIHRQGSNGRIEAVFFDVDFTLIYPGPMFQAVGYERCAREHGMTADPARFHDAVCSAAEVLEEQQEHVYDTAIFVRYTRRILEAMGAHGPRLDECAGRLYDEWAACRHFFLYDDVEGVLRELSSAGVKIGLISNSHRSLDAFQDHFDLRDLISGGVSSSEHGYMKPHRSIFESALARLGVSAAASVMVGDSFPHDIEGAQRAGMHGVLVHRSDAPVPEVTVPVVRSLRELPALVLGR